MGIDELARPTHPLLLLQEGPYWQFIPFHDVRQA
jgi:hypothetical protein